MVDRDARNRLIASIRAYLAEEITSFKFDDQINDILDSTKDRTVEYIVSHLWGYYDDCKNHKVVASREGWDFFQRILLLLESDGEVEQRSQRRWTVRQLLASIALALFVISVIAAVIQVGFGWHLILVGMPFCLIAWGLFSWSGPSRREDPARLRLLPFSTMAALLHTHRRVRRFRKQRYPIGLAGRRIRTPREVMYLTWIWISVSLVASPVLAPLLLVVSMLPETKPRVVVP